MIDLHYIFFFCVLFLLPEVIVQACFSFSDCVVIYFEIDAREMKAVIAHGPKEYEFVNDKEIPKLKDGEVLVKVLATGICK